MQSPDWWTLGWEDMRAFVAAAEAEDRPVILQAGPSCRAHTPLPVLGKMFRHLAEGASVPVVAHLDHGYTFEECQQALDAGFTSLMFDGSRKPLAENIADTARVAQLAHDAGISCEGEIGFVGYSGGEGSARDRSGRGCPVRGGNRRRCDGGIGRQRASAAASRGRAGRRPDRGDPRR